MNKRGISPLIASVLIIGFTIVLAAMVMVWGVDIFKNYQEKTTFNSQLKLDCATKVDLNIKEACDLGNRIRLKLENMGEVNIEGLRLRIVSPFGIHSEENSSVLAPFSLSNFERPYVLTSSPDKVDIFPKIKVDGKEGTCSAVSKDIVSCFKLPSTLSCDGWTVEGGSCGFVKDYLTELGIEDDVEEFLKQGIYVLNDGSTPISLTSEHFIIPKEVNSFSVSGLSSEGTITYKLILLTGEEIQEGYLSPNLIDISKRFINVEQYVGKEAYIIIEKPSGGFATVSQINYEII